MSVYIKLASGNKQSESTVCLLSSFESTVCVYLHLLVCAVCVFEAWSSDRNKVFCSTVGITLPSFSPHLLSSLHLSVKMHTLLLQVLLVNGHLMISLNTYFNLKASFSVTFYLSVPPWLYSLSVHTHTHPGEGAGSGTKKGNSCWFDGLLAGFTWLHQLCVHSNAASF